MIKFFNYSTTFGLSAILFLSSCQKDKQSIEPLKNETKLDFDSSEVQANAEIVYGVELLSASDYALLPVLDTSEASMLPKAEMLLTEKDGANKTTALTKTIAMPAVKSQGSEGSCGAWTFAYTIGSWKRRAINGEVNAYLYTNCISPEYVHNNCKVGSCSSGATMKTYLNFMKNNGAPRISSNPVNYYNCSVKTTTGTKYKFNDWKTVNKTSSDIKYWLNKNYPIGIAITIDGNFYAQADKAPYIVTSNGGAQYGGHAVTIIGYDDSKQAFKVQNQWGANRHQNGYFYIKYSAVANIVKEAYIVW